MTRQNPLWLQDLAYPASLDRNLLGALYPSGGVSGCQVTASGSGMALTIDPGTVAVPAANGTGTVLCHSDAVETVTLDPAEPSGTERRDLVVCQVHGADLDGGSANDFVFVFVKGTPAPPPAPTPATPPGALALAMVTVAGGTAAIVAGNITDKRAGRLEVNPPGPGLVTSAFYGGVTTNAYGQWSPPDPGGLIQAAVAVGTQKDYPHWHTIDGDSLPLPATRVIFQARHVDGSWWANAALGVSAILAYRPD